MKVKSSTLPQDLVDMIKNPDPIEGEDITIEDESGKPIGFIIQPDAYAFFLKKVREREDELDSKLSEDYNESAKSLDDLLEDD